VPPQSGHSIRAHSVARAHPAVNLACTASCAGQQNAQGPVGTLDAGSLDESNGIEIAQDALTTEDTAFTVQRFNNARILPFRAQWHASRR